MQEIKYPDGIPATYRNEEFEKDFPLQLVTKEFIFYADVTEFGERGSIVMLRRNMELVSDNYFAKEALLDAKDDKESIEWASKDFNEWVAIEEELEKKERKFVCIWGRWSGPSTYDPCCEVEDLDYFTTDIGYDEDDIAEITKLEPGETWESGGGSHMVTRMC